MTLVRAVSLCCVLLLIPIAATAKSSDNSDKNARVVKVGVALLKNTATRSVPVKVERDRLVTAINRQKPPKHAKDAFKIQAVALDSDLREEADAQARELGCEYVVFTNLTELRESGDPAPAPRPGEIRIGKDPVANDPNVFYRHDVQRYAVMGLSMFRLGDPGPRFDTTATEHEATTDDGIVSLLMDRVANRVVSEIRNSNPRPPIE